MIARGHVLVVTCADWSLVLPVIVDDVVDIGFGQGHWALEVVFVLDTHTFVVVKLVWAFNYRLLDLVCLLDTNISPSWVVASCNGPDSTTLWQWIFTTAKFYMICKLRARRLSCILSFSNCRIFFALLGFWHQRRLRRIHRTRHQSSLRCANLLLSYIIVTSLKSLLNLLLHGSFRAYISHIYYPLYTTFARLAVSNC